MPTFHLHSAGRRRHRRISRRSPTPRPGNCGIFARMSSARDVPCACAIRLSARAAMANSRRQEGRGKDIPAARCSLFCRAALSATQAHSGAACARRAARGRCVGAARLLPACATLFAPLRGRATTARRRARLLSCLRYPCCCSTYLVYREPRRRCCTCSTPSRRGARVLYGF